MLTLPQYHEVLSRLFKTRSDSKLSQAAMETLAILAYRQPILRVDVEAIRGVACGEVLRGLMEKNLVKIVGRAEVIGRPMLYGTTKNFLEIFGLGSLEDLPRVEELRSGAKETPKPPAAAEASPEIATETATETQDPQQNQTAENTKE
jgi:segregation and condensation protein B